MNHRSTDCMLTITYVDGSFVRLYVSPGLATVDAQPVNVTVECGKLRYTIIPLHNHTVYVLIPPFNYSLTVNVLHSYSILDQDWHDAPPGLAFMAGLWENYVEEETAGRLFNMYYYAA